MQERFKLLLKEKKLTAAQFSDRIHVNPSAMSHILNGRSKPGFDVLDKIGQAFPDVNLNWLICGKGVPTKQPTQTPETVELLPNEDQADVNNVLHDPLPTNETKLENKKQIKRIILFFDDGSFEEYEK